MFGRDFVLLGLNPFHILPSSAESGIAGVGSVNLEHVSAGNLRVRVVLGADPGDVDSILAAGDFLHEHIHANVVAVTQ